ncbi:protein piccolo-like [Lagenorhynchus albirostris]|uniref:protein piccolo-like n=1 Tax=Lagenorhynchus albirostris TaxID=27610 RepID=UPI0028EE94DB|nr:protein piccolo-like [Lagenorhynchus albirostris]
MVAIKQGFLKEELCVAISACQEIQVYIAKWLQVILYITKDLIGIYTGQPGLVEAGSGESAEYKRRTKYVQKSLNPEWNQTVIYKSISMEQLKKKTLEMTVWDYDRFSSNDFLGEVLIDLSNTSHLDNMPRWYPLKEQTESIDHGKPYSSQSSQQSPKPSVIKSRSHGIFPDLSKEMQVPTIEKSHSSPGSSKSSSKGHLRSHGPSRGQSKTSVTQTHLEDAGAAIAAAKAAVQQLRLQPSKRRK